MPPVAGIFVRPGVAAAPAGAQLGATRATADRPHRSQCTTSPSGRQRGRVRTAGYAAGRERGRESIMERADRAPSLLAVSCSGGSQSALSGALWGERRIGTRLFVVVLAGVEDGGARPVDRLERGATRGQSPVAGEQ